MKDVSQQISTQKYKKYEKGSMTPSKTQNSSINESKDMIKHCMSKSSMTEF